MPAGRLSTSLRSVTGSSDSPVLLLGPLLRYVDDHRATIWVETDRPCRVEVLGVIEPTWTVHGHHYAVVSLTGLESGTEHEYSVHLDGNRSWPPETSAFPPSVIRTFSDGETFRLAFGSCRRAAPMDAESLRRFGADALVALANRMASSDTARWPDALFLAGDQVYADVPSPPLKARLREVHGHPSDDDPMSEVVEEIQNYEEYTWLYHESWAEEAVRWLLSTVPSCMMLDDHDLRDDWNTSYEWRQWVTNEPWWRDRVVGAYASYWVYQHLGNLSPDELARDRTYEMVRGTDDDDERTRLLDEFAWEADARPTSTRWSFRRDFGNEDLKIRLVSVDSRCSRVLEPDRRAMVDDTEWDWFTRQVLPREGERIDHMMIGTTLPFLLLKGIHHLEGWDEAVAAGAWGRRAVRLAEKVRQGVDLEHWAAFRATFQRMVELIDRLGSGSRPPASILLLSGDVHCSYTARASTPSIDPARTGLHQLTMSPFRNPLEPPIRVANHVLKTRFARNVIHWLARRAGVDDVAIEWDIDNGLWFDNGVMTVVFDGRTAHVEVDHAAVTGRPAPEAQELRRTLTLELTP